MAGLYGTKSTLTGINAYIKDVHYIGNPEQRTI